MSATAKRIAALLLTAAPCFAALAEINWVYRVLNEDDKTAYIRAADNSYEGDITIPSEINGYTIVMIYRSTFAEHAELTGVTIPDTVTNIGRSAFNACANLERVNLPASLETIDNAAFSQCRALKEVAFPASIQTIGQSAFNECTSLKSISLPEGLRAIDNSAFNGCTALEAVEIPASVSTIGSKAFLECSSLRNVTFNDCAALEIYQSAFAYSALSGELNLPEGLTFIDNFAFDYCSNITSVTFPTTVTNIEANAFRYCTGLTELTVPDNVVKVDSSFYGCTNIVSITIPQSVLDNNIRNCFGPASTDKIKNIMLSASVTNISNWAFSNCRAIESIDIPEGVTSIGAYAFYLCDALKSVSLPDGLEWIGQDAFTQCTALERIAIPASVGYIGLQAFSGCQSLTSLAISPGVTNIANNAFASCSGLTQVFLPETVETLGENVFQECKRLTGIYAPSSLAGGWLDLDGYETVVYYDVDDAAGEYVFSVSNAAQLATALAIDPAPSPLRITLTDDIAGTFTVPETVANAVVDLAGHTLTSDAGAIDGYSALPLASGETSLTVLGAPSTVENPIKITLPAADGEDPFADVPDNACVEITVGEGTALPVAIPAGVTNAVVVVTEDIDGGCGVDGDGLPAFVLEGTKTDLTFRNGRTDGGGVTVKGGDGADETLDENGATATPAGNGAPAVSVPDGYAGTVAAESDVAVKGGKGGDAASVSGEPGKGAASGLTGDDAEPEDGKRVQSTIDNPIKLTLPADADKIANLPDGAYIEITLDDDIAGPLAIPANVEHAAINLNGKAIRGIDGLKDGNDGMDGTAAIVVEGAGTSLSVVGPGSATGGDGADSAKGFAGAGGAGIATPGGWTGEVVVSGGAVVQGGRGGDTENGSAGDGGAGVEVAAGSVAKVSATGEGTNILGGRGGDATDATGDAGDGGDGVRNDGGKVVVEASDAAKVAGGDGGDALGYGDAGRGGEGAGEPDGGSGRTVALAEGGAAVSDGADGKAANAPSTVENPIRITLPAADGEDPFADVPDNACVEITVGEGTALPVAIPAGVTNAVIVVTEDIDGGRGEDGDGLPAFVLEGTKTDLTFRNGRTDGGGVTVKGGDGADETLDENGATATPAGNGAPAVSVPDGYAGTVAAESGVAVKGGKGGDAASVSGEPGKGAASGLTGDDAEPEDGKRVQSTIANPIKLTLPADADKLADLPDGAYIEITLDDDIAGPLAIPANVEHAAINLNGKEIRGIDGLKDGNDGMDGTAAIVVEGAGTSLSVVGPGSATGGDGADSAKGFAGAGGAGIATPDGWTGEVVVSGGAVVQGGRGGATEKGIAGDGGDGVYIGDGAAASVTATGAGTEILGGRGGDATSGIAGDGGAGVRNDGGRAVVEVADSAVIAGGDGGDAHGRGAAGDGGAGVETDGGSSARTAVSSDDGTECVVRGGNGGTSDGGGDDGAGGRGLSDDGRGKTLDGVEAPAKVEDGADGGAAAETVAGADGLDAGRSDAVRIVAIREADGGAAWEISFEVALKDGVDFGAWLDASAAGGRIKAKAAEALGGVDAAPAETAEVRGGDAAASTVTIAVPAVGATRFFRVVVE